MRICILSELFYPYMVGGAERRYYEIAVRLAKKHEVVVYSLRFDGHEDREEHRGVEIIRTGSSHPLDKRSIPALATYFPAVLRGVTSNSDIIDANQGIASFAGLFKPLVKAPIIATFHDLYWNQWNDYFPFPLSSIGKSMEFLWSKMPYDAVIANSSSTSRKLANLGFRNIETIPSGIDIGFIRRVKAKKRKNSVVYVGRLVKYKNIDMLIRALEEIKEEIPDIKLNVVGSGPEEYNLRRLAEELDVDVEFFGFATEEEKFKVMKSSEILVNPSSVEGLGLILIEAMAAEVPVIAKKLDAYFFYNGKNAVLYENTEEIKDRIIDVLTSQKRKKALVKSGYDTAKKYSWDSVAHKVERLYERLAK